MGTEAGLGCSLLVSAYIIHQVTLAHMTQTCTSIDVVTPPVEPTRAPGATQEVLSSSESDTTLSSAELSPHYRTVCRKRHKIEWLQAAPQGGAHRKEIVADDLTEREGLQGGADGAGGGASDCLTAEQQGWPESPSQVLQAGIVLAATAEGLARLLDRGDAFGDGGDGDSGHQAHSLLVSKHTLTACLAEVAQRRLHVDRLLEEKRRSSSTTKGFPWEEAASKGTGARSERVGAAVAAGGGDGEGEVGVVGEM